MLFCFFFLGDFHIQVSEIPIHALGPDSFLGYAGMHHSFHSMDIWRVWNFFPLAHQTKAAGRFSHPLTEKVRKSSGCLLKWRGVDLSTSDEFVTRTLRTVILGNVIVMDHNYGTKPGFSHSASRKRVECGAPFWQKTIGLSQRGIRHMITWIGI